MVRKRPIFRDEPRLFTADDKIDRRENYHADDHIDVKKNIENERTDKNHQITQGFEVNSATPIDGLGGVVNSAIFHHMRMIDPNEAGTGRTRLETAPRYFIYSASNTRIASELSIHLPLVKSEFTTG
jgi:hypothetical protein